MFPSVRLYGPFRHYAIGSLFLMLFAYQLSLALSPQRPTVQTDDPRLADTVAYEDVLYQKATLVLHRFGVSHYSIDLSVTLDHLTVTTTTFDPGLCRRESTGELLRLNEQTPGAVAVESGGTWQEKVDNSPQVRSIRIRVTHKQDLDPLQRENLHQSLAFALGIEPTRGDILTVDSL